MQGIAANIEALKAQIRHASTKRAQDSGQPLIVAVSKKQPVEAIRAAYEAGLAEFGENYVQEAAEKQQQLAGLPLTWHFIGPIQSNKTRAIAGQFDWVHSVARLKIAQRLGEQRPQTRGPLQLCLQVNIDNDEAKAGVSANQLMGLAEQVAGLPGLTLRGLMVLPRQSEDRAQTRASFRRGRTLFDETRAELAKRSTGLGNSFDTLSMGMSGDFELAVEEGANLLRLGAAIFGPRSG
ncbi:MAG: YggS family pyridoxal phosphate-dependent enzyme [Pseudomonadales bacterium]